MGILQAESLPRTASVSQPPKGVKCRRRALTHKSHLWKTRLERAHRAVEMSSEFMRLRTEATGLGWRERSTQRRASRGANGGSK